MLKLIAKARKYVVDFKIDHELTMVSGDSGTGKTYVCSLINKCKDADAVSITASNGLQYTVNIVVTLNDLRALLSDGSPHLIFIDKLEQLDLEDKLDARDLIMRSLRSTPDFNYFIIMYRGITYLGFTETIYELVFSDNKFRLVEREAL